MHTRIDNNHIDRQVQLEISMGLLILLGSMGFDQTAMGQEQTKTETPATIQSPSLVTGQIEDLDTGPSSPLSPEQLEELVGPVALYPDDLIGIIIPASTYPLQVVQAVRYLKQYEQDPDLKINDTWDDSIVALLNYPEVLKMMDEDLDWTWKLGAAVVNQQDDVMDAIQQFRQRALAAGNLDSDDKQIVSHEGSTIEVKPADPEVIYVPFYVPEEVIVYQTVPVYHYYPVAYPVYYYPYGPDYRFRTSFFWGLSSAFYIGWNTHYIHAFPHDYYRHPYYGSTFYFNYYGHNYQRSHRPHHRDVSNHVNVRNRDGVADYRWRPSRHTSGARPHLANNGTQGQRTGSRNQRTTNNQRISTTNSLPASRLARTQSTLQADQNTKVQRRTNTDRIGRTARNNQQISATSSLPAKRSASTQPILKTDLNTRVQRRTNTNRSGIAAHNNQQPSSTSSLPAKRSASTQPILKTDLNTRVQRRTNTNSLPANRSASTQSRPRSSQGANTRTRNSSPQTLAQADTAASRLSGSQSDRGFSAQKRTRSQGAGNQSRSRTAWNDNSRRR